MKKGLLITLGVILVIGFIIYRVFAGSYNSMVDKEENVSQAWANVEAQYQRRADLIPNLVNTVKGFAAQEKDVLTGVVEARSKATSVQVDANNLDAAKMQQFQQAQGQLSGALSRLLVTVERYPELKSNQNFLDLQAQLEGTENRITVARTRFNGEATNYNKLIRTFPKNLLAGMYGFERKPLFEADQGAESAPEVQF